MDSPLPLSAVLPCFEEAPHLREVVAALGEALAGSTEQWEIVLVVSEAARDGTPHVARELAEEMEHVRVVSQPARDPGYGRAVALGIEAARHAHVLLTDSDGQFDHRELPRLVASLGEAEAVVGVRAPRRDPWARRAAGAVYTGVVTRLLGLGELRDVDCAFKLVDTRLLGAAPLRSRTGAINAELLSRVRTRGGRVVEVEVSHRPRRGGQTRFEMRLGILSHLPHPGEVWAIAQDVAALAARRLRAARGRAD
ncbi:MAG: glycosyltransferase family 2 protein [bacterium]